MLTLRDFEILRTGRDNLGVRYDSGCYYGTDELITGHWLTIPEQEFDTDELSKEDIFYNEN